METVVCPVCGTPTSLNPVIIEDDKAFFPDSSTNTRKIYGKARVFAFKYLGSPDYINYGIFKCQACGKHFIAKKHEAKKHEYDDIDWVAVYPIPYKPVSEDIPQPIKSEFEEANLCYTVGAHRACVSMCQRVLESLCQNKDVPRLNQLKEDGIISSTLFDRATEVRLWAGITKHKPLTESVSKEDTEQLLLYLEMILNSIYVEPKRFEALKQKRKQMEEKSE